MKAYIDRPVSLAELKDLCALAVAEENRFFDRNPHLIESYRKRLIAVALCQGAALQYLRWGYGVNDFDVHYFYLQDSAKPRMSRAVTSTWCNVGSFQGIEVDFIRTVVPLRTAEGERDRVGALQKFLQNAPTLNARHLRKKAVIGLLPEELFSVIIWPPKKAANQESLQESYREMAEDEEHERAAEEWIEALIGDGFELQIPRG